MVSTRLLREALDEQLGTESAERVLSLIRNQAVQSKLTHCDKITGFDKYLFDVDANEEKISNLICSVCMEQISFIKDTNKTNNKTNNLNDKISKLSCGHIYHNDCIKTWLKNKLICPYCRTNCSVKPNIQNI
jgi:hypothetical protein